MDRVEQHIRQRGINLFIMYCEHVAQRLTCFVIDQAVDLFKVRRSDFFYVLRHLDFGNDLAVLIFNRCELVYAAEHRLGL